MTKEDPMPPFSLLVKPASADCNLSCEYCFYTAKSNLYPGARKHRMSDSVLERLMETYMKTEQPVYSICWQGGEPTLTGTGFFSKAVEFQKQYGHAGARVSNSVQTNATLITDEMAAFFAEYNFLVGCSLDGPGELHNLYRRTVTGKSTHREVLKGIEILKLNNVQFNILTLVSRANVDHARVIYHYLKNMGFCHQQYIPCVEFDQNGKLMPFAITGEEWGAFMCGVFDAWYLRDIFSVSVRNFDSILSKKVDGVDNVCVMGENCCRYFVVEYNGDIYPCDFFVEKPLKLGNIMETSWEEMANAHAYLEFGAQKKRRNEKCSTCSYLELCAGDCLKNRIYAGNPSRNLSCLCPGLEHFFSYTESRFDKISGKIEKDRRRQRIMADKSPKVRRNDPCSCGSGIKLKKCCGKYNI